MKEGRNPRKEGRKKERNQLIKPKKEGRKPRKEGR